MSRLLLLVEDDPLVRGTLVEGLADAGFEVIEVEDAETGLEMLASRPDICVLLTDINLPGADGFSLAYAARMLRPDLPIVYTSGRHRQAEPGRAVPGAPFLPKPFTIAHACTTLEGAIGRLC
ncbi:response regulator [Falsiroseomonas sp. CW058]|uniref:response regulator n=1 Tax=Falsiroseomonas sp. CW058 TaxID=3388664 RepID=UPI003D31D78E